MNSHGREIGEIAEIGVKNTKGSRTKDTREQTIQTDVLACTFINGIDSPLLTRSSCPLHLMDGRVLLLPYQAQWPTRASQQSLERTPKKLTIILIEVLETYM